MREGRFREDLFYRLHVVPVRMPPLRERERDILLIARHFLERFNTESGKNFESFSEEAEEQLLRYPWPGNVRQLQNVVQQTIVLNDGDEVALEMLPADVREGHIDVEPTAAAPVAAPAETATVTPITPQEEVDPLALRRAIEPLWMVEKRAIEAAIEACDGNINRAAGLLEVAPSTLYRKKQSWERA